MESDAIVQKLSAALAIYSTANEVARSAEDSARKVVENDARREPLTEDAIETIANKLAK